MTQPVTTRRTRDGSLENDNWGTPKALYDKLDAEFHFDFDPCPLRSTFDGLSSCWGYDKYVNINLWKSNVQNVSALNPPIISIVGQKGCEDTILNARLAKEKGDQRVIEEIQFLNQKEICWQKLDLRNAQTAKLCSHLIHLTFLLSLEHYRGSVPGAGGVSELAQEKIWLRDVQILRQKILLKLQKENMQSLLKDVRGNESAVLSVITSVEEILLSGLKNNGNCAKYTLETVAPIADQKSFLLKTILFLYHTLIVREQSKQTLSPPVLNVTAQKTINIQMIGLDLLLSRELQTILQNYRIKHNFVAFINPPYNRVDKPKFIRKAFEEWQKGNTCVLLIPAAVSTAQFHDLILPHAEVRFLRGRVGFVGDYGEGKKKGKHDSMIVIFRGKNV